MEKFHDKMEENFVIDTGNKEFQDALSLIQYTSQSVFLTEHQSDNSLPERWAMWKPLPQFIQTVF